MTLEPPGATSRAAARRPWDPPVVDESAPGTVSARSATDLGEGRVRERPARYADAVIDNASDPQAASDAPEAPGAVQPGLLISFEGGDGVGKTTQIRILADLLAAADVDHVLTREPGGTGLGGAIRELLLHGGDIAPRAEALLYAADRAHHVATRIRPALERGEIVLTDRYLDSSVAYQGAARALGPEDVRALSLWATDGLLPDLTILLDAEPGLATRRIMGRGAKDRLERETDAFHTALRAQFLALAEAEPARFVVIDADRPVDEVADDVIEAAVGAVQRHGARFRHGAAHQRVLLGLEAFVAAATAHRGGAR